MITRASMTIVACALAIAAGACGDASVGGDADGIRGGTYVFVVRVSDTGLDPLILKSENSAQVKVTVRNVGTKPHGFALEGVDASELPPIAPGESADIDFETPDEEAIYTVRSTAPDDAFTGQWIID